MVPVLTVPGQKPLTDSSDIVEYADQNSITGFRLYPDDQTEVEKIKKLERCLYERHHYAEIQ